MASAFKKRPQSSAARASAGLLEQNEDLLDRTRAASFEDNPAVAAAGGGADDAAAAGDRRPLCIDVALEQVGYGWFQQRLFLLCGLCFMADAMEVMVLGFLQTEVSREWGLDSYQESFVTAAVFGGELLGAASWGPFADRRGRRPAYLGSCVLIAVFGFASAAAPSFGALLLFRCLVGIGIGGLAVPFDLLSEFLPTAQRGKMMMAIQYFWTFGTLLVAALAWASLDARGWRFLVAMCAVPPTICLLAFPLLPESPRWLLERGRRAEAAEVLRHAALVNAGGALGHGLVLSAEGEELCLFEGHKQGRVCEEKGVSDLFRTPQLKKITLLTWAVWFGFGCTYYGLVLLLPHVFPAPAGSCFNYAEIFISGTGEAVGLTVAVLLIDSVGRKGVQMWGYALCGLMMVIVGATLSDGADAPAPGEAAEGACAGGAEVATSLPHWLLVALALGARGAIMGASTATWLMAPELFETALRSTGHSSSNAMARLGGFVTPFIADASGMGVGGAAIFYGFVNFGVAACCACYPFDTAGRDMDAPPDAARVARGTDGGDDGRAASVQEPASNPIASLAGPAADSM